MDSLYKLGVRQVASIQQDLERMRDGNTSASLQGQIAASLAALDRTVSDYDNMARREMIKAKQEKASLRLKKFKEDYSDLRSQFNDCKSQAAAQRSNAQRAELIPHASDPRKRNLTTPSENAESPYRTPSPFYAAPTREDHALREHSFIRNTEARLDDFLAQGREVLDNLHDQRNVLKGTQRRLLDTANTLGLSRDVIGWIEKRSKQDVYIFMGGAIFTFFCFYWIWRLLG